MKTQCSLVVTNLTVNIILVLLLFPVATSASSSEDVVHLKDGSVLQGEIIEQVPGESLKIKIAGGTVFNITMDKIAKITKTVATAEKPSATFEFGAGYLALGGDAGKLYDNTVGIPIGFFFRIMDKAEIGIQYVQSSEFNDIGESLGIINGPDMYFGEVHAVFRYSSQLGGTNSVLHPYAAFGLGITHLKIDGKTVDNYVFPEITEDKLSLSVETGIRLIIVKRFGLHLGARYSHITTEFASANHVLIGFGFDIGIGTF